MVGYKQARCASMVFLAFAIAGCQSAGIDDLAPSAAVAEPLALADAGVPVPGAAPREAAKTAAPETAPVVIQPAAAAPKNTGEFPKIGNVPVGETAQLGAGGAAVLRSDLAAARSSQAAAADAPESYAEKLRRLRLLQARHAAETLAEIEAKKPQ
jgi:hypothetical protein